MTNMDNMIRTIKNGQRVGKPFVMVPSRKLNLRILYILQREGYIHFWRQRRNGLIQVQLKYNNLGAKKGVIREFRRISVSGRRYYLNWKTLWSIDQGLGIWILSTNRGVITDREARKWGIGGEVICYISLIKPSYRISY